jgi:predicted PhzF superfamily epimerase YddE/YHI9
MYQVDAFTGTLFRGNPAAVCLLREWLPDDTLLSIAAENKLSETAFCLGGEGQYGLRWFTPTMEIDLCGHATLAAAFVLCAVTGRERGPLLFRTMSGDLKVTRENERYILSLPRREGAACEAPDELTAGLGRQPREVLRAGNDYLAVFDSEAEVRSLEPAMEPLAKLPGALIVTAPAAAEELDFVSRVFAPAEGIPEDPVTGSAHCSLVPYWAKRLGAERFRAEQVSRRGGTLFCRDRGAQIEVAGEAVLYLTGEISI